MIKRRVTAVLIAVAIAMGGASAVLIARRDYSVYVVRTGSMLPTVRPGDAVLNQPPPASHEVGDIITFAAHTGTDSLITHRVEAVEPDGSLRTKGDANRTRDAWTVAPEEVRGATVRTIPYLGYVIVYLHNRAGVASVVTLALVVALAWGLFFMPTVPRSRQSQEPSSMDDVVAGSDGPRLLLRIALSTAGVLAAGVASSRLLRAD